MSFDGGKSFTKIVPPMASSDTSLNSCKCLFTRFSKDSHVGDESDILCWFAELSENFIYESYKDTALYLSKGFGKTLTAVEQFNSSPFYGMKMLDNYAIVFTNGSFSKEDSVFKMGVFKSGSKFQEAKFPE